MERAVYDRMAEIDEDHWWFAARRKILGALIDQRIPLEKGAHILEIGCGTGSNIPLLQTYGTVDAIEPDDDARALSTRRTGVAVKGGLFPHGVRLDDAHYDLIALFDVLEHMPNDREALTALRPKLKDGGRVLATVPAMPWLWSAHDVAHHHHRRYTARQLRCAFASCGYTITYMTYFNTLLFPLVVAARAAGKLLGKESSDDAIPSKPLNQLLGGIFAAERHMISRARLPIGVSLAVIAE